MVKFKYFSVPDVFEFKRGVRFTEDEHIVGDTPYISSSKDNNGISAHVTPPVTTQKGAKVVVYNNCLTLNNSGSVGYLFYHNYDFIASDHVTVLWPKDKHVSLTPNIALFLKPIFEKMRYKYNFGREISNSRLKQENILLPIDKNEAPDWQYMENYIADNQRQISFHNIETKQSVTQSLSIADWQEFQLSEIFNYTRGIRLTRFNRISGEIPLVTAGHRNYGISEYISNEDMPVFNNCITIDMFGNVFWKDCDICCDDNIIAISIKDRELNKYLAMFLVSALKKITSTFDYGRQYRLKHFLKQSILLPVKSISQFHEKKIVPDWEYMEKYIKSLPYADLI